MKNQVCKIQPRLMTPYFFIMSIQLRRFFFKTVLKQKKYESVQVRLQHSQEFMYEIPEEYQKTFYLANASLHDNIEWYFHRGVEAAFKKYVSKIKLASPCLNNDTIEKLAINAINTLDATGNILQMTFPLKRNNGTVEIIKAYCVQHGLHYDTHLGGLRFCEKVEKPHIKALAALSSYKYVNVDLPFAGAHAGIKINPANYAPIELKDIINNFTKILKKNNFISPKINIFEPDLNCTPEIMNTFIDAYKRLSGNVSLKNLACITGKSRNHGGIKYYEDAIADGIMTATDNYLHNEELMSFIGLSAGWADKTYIIKGLGKVGQRLVEKLTKEGAKCIGVLEKNAGLYNKYGIDIQGAVQYMKDNGNLLNFSPVCLPANKVLNETCDILIVASAHQTITYYTAPNLKARMIIEAANGALTPTAHKILLAKKTLVLPDIYVNCGAAVASYMEHVKNSNESGSINAIVEKEPTTLLEMDSFGKTKLVSIEQDEEDSSVKENILARINVYSQNLMAVCNEFGLGIDIRTGAYILATQKIFDMLQDNKSYK